MEVFRERSSLVAYSWPYGTSCARPDQLRRHVPTRGLPVQQFKKCHCHPSHLPVRDNSAVDASGHWHYQASMWRFV